ncbi:DUF3761 domain-containing protein [Streptomyces sp. RPA4-5]|uniref:DUF3761 domain-containing protein n=1 Tax=Streptomyces sp. RPA4-5 TaxID=2721245 RepID=UPI002001E4C6|nr:DUF3761 domain-containing protein [Streptomyces sp. RPA4-5]
MTGNQRPVSPEEKKNARLGCAVIAVFVLLVGGCVNLMDGDEDSKSSTSSSVSDAADASDGADGADAADETDAPDAPDASDATDGGDASDSESSTVTVPDYAGSNLQEAQDDAQGRGIYLLESRDLSVRHRTQVWDRNWQVCAQEPTAGSDMADTETLTFTVVKTGESCDAPDAAGSAGDDGDPEPTGDPAGDGSSGTSGSSSSSGADGGGSSGSSGSSSSSGGSSSSGSTGSDGGSSSTSGGEEEAQAPAGASAQCNDGTYSYSAHRRGTCSHHHGVAVWLRSLPA